MKDKAFRYFLVLFLCLALATPVLAQAPDVPHIVDTTRPVLPQVRQAVDELLAVNAPVPDVLTYVITYAKSNGDPSAWRVSIAAIDPWSDHWHLDEDAVWWGSLDVIQTGDGYEASYRTAIFDGFHSLAAPALNGGSSSVRFPWMSGKSAMYGPRGVHGGAFGTSGMVAVDWVGGNDMGSNIMPDTIYASAGGTVDAVCEDGTTVGIRIATGSEYFAYLHLMDNANLEEGHTFGTGSTIGTLKHGSFDDDCGWAEQQDSHYHVHWGFMPASGRYQAEGCILNTDTEIWDCGQNQVAPNEFMYGGGGSGDGDDDPAEGIVEVGFWDYMVVGFIGIGTALIVNALPDHQDIVFLETVAHGIIAVFAITYVMTKGAVTLYLAFLVISLILFFEALRLYIVTVMAIVRAIDALPGVP